MIQLAPVDLVLATLLVLVSAGLTRLLRLGIAASLLVAGARMVVQLLLVGLVLKALFGHASLHWVVLIALVMLGVAGYEVMARQRRRLTGWWGVGIGFGAMFVSSFSVTLLALVAILGPSPWYTPQYAVPLLGMILGNTMNGVALGVDRLTQTVWEQRNVVEGRLMLGQRWSEALGDIRQDCMRSGMIPTINGMAAAGVVSLPGMMTGQILAGTPPVEAVKYQILIFCLIAAGTTLGTAVAVRVAARRLFDGRERLRLERLTGS